MRERPILIFRDGEGRVRNDLALDQLEALLESGEGSLWLDVDAEDDEEYRLLTDLFHFHPLAVEDVRSPECRIKIGEYDGALFIVVREAEFRTEQPGSYLLDTKNFYLFIGDRFIVTAHLGHSKTAAEIGRRFASGADLLARGVDHLAYEILDTLVDEYFPLLDQIDDFVDELEDRIFHSRETRLVEQIFELKRALLLLRRQLAPMREVAMGLANRPSHYLRPETQVYLRGFYDHLVRQLESVETYRELVASVLEMNLMVLSNQVNEVMKALSIIATVVLPPTLVASIYGMNFEHLPGTSTPIGFWLALLAMALISGAFLYYLWRKRWL